MPTFYGRHVVLRIAGLRFESQVGRPGVRIGFSIEREPDGTPPNGSVRLYNIAPPHVKDIRTKGEMLRLDAGYGDAISEIFTGHVERVNVDRQSTDRITTVEFGGLVDSPERLGGVTTRSWQGLVEVRDIITDLVVNDLGLDIGSLDAIPDDSYVDNWAWSGRTDGAITILCRRNGATWFDDDGVVRIARFGRGQSDAPAMVLSPETGLVGSPEETERGATAVTLLRPEARIGSSVAVRSETLNGTWLLAGLRHAGDSRYGTFLTNYELRNPDDSDDD